MAKQWIVNEIDEQKRDWISRQLGISPLLATILVGRGIDDPEGAERFLEPQILHLNDPFLLPDIEAAVGRIRKAITDYEKILVFGHDDTDGATSTVVMMEALRDLGASPEEYIPDRTTEGYGFRREILERFERRGVKLIVTVDSETSDFPGVRMAHEMGLDVIITDHHEIHNGLPRALAVVNPKRGDSRYPFRNLAGVGVAFQVARAITGDSAFDFDKYLDLAALGTIADRVPLVEDNRIFSRLGYQRLKNSPRPGIAALQQASLEQESPQEIIVPLKYGVSREGTYSSALLLQTGDPQEAGRIATELWEQSRQKQRETQAACARVATQVQEKKLQQASVVVIVDKETPLRTLGACASFIRRHFGLPAVVIGFQGEHVVGEGRAPVGFDIFAAFKFCEDLFIQYGGHRGAGGFSMDPKNINEFRLRINQFAQEIAGWRFSPPYLRIDALLDPATADQNFLAQLDRLIPFGQANAQPQFCCQRVRVEVYPEPSDEEALGTVNSISFRLANDLGIPSTILQTLGSTKSADVVYLLERTRDGAPMLIIQDVNVD